MNKSNIKELSAGTEADSNSTAQNPYVSQPNANTNVGRSSNCMRVLKLVHPTGHPYWQEGEFEIILPDGSKYPMYKHQQNFGHGYKIEIRQDGLYYVLHFCGSGYGKVPCTDGRYPPLKIVSSTEYDKIEYVGEELKMSDTLKSDLVENGLS